MSAGQNPSGEKSATTKIDEQRVWDRQMSFRVDLGKTRGEWSSHGGTRPDSLGSETRRWCRMLVYLFITRREDEPFGSNNGGESNWWRFSL